MYEEMQYKRMSLLTSKGVNSFAEFEKNIEEVFDVCASTLGSAEIPLSANYSQSFVQMMLLSILLDRVK